jgi:uncharacterized repeat protein (TIGR01451 family)
VRRIVLITILLCLYAPPAGAVSYFVSTSGDDDSDGLTVGTAWKSPDNGDIKGLLAPGDTIFIEPGTYMPDRSYVFTTSGTNVDPIVYTKSSGGAAAIRTLSGTNAALRIQGDYLEFHTLDISCDVLATIGGIEIDGSFCLVSGCEVFGVYLDGIKLNGGGNTLLRNIIHSCDDNGIESTASASGNHFYGNTVYDNGLNGVEMFGSGNANRVFNNIVVLNAQYGISGSADNVCGFSDVWGNSGGDYANGVADSSGGISEDPLFVDGPGGDFSLQSDSPAINAGLDLGYPYYGPAPDMGALESSIAPPVGTAIWRSEASSIPKESEWNGVSFSLPEGTADVGVWKIIAGAEAPMRDEIVLVGIGADASVTFEVWDGTSWTASPLNPLATVSETFWWGCDVAYMAQSGDAMVVWNNGSGGTDGLSYLVGNQFGWSEEDTIATPLAGEPKHMHLAANPTSDEMVLIVSNEFSQDYAIVWDGGTWGNAEVLDNSGAGDDRTDIYVAYEQQSGEALTVYGWGLSAVYYSTWNGADWSASQGLAKPADASGHARWTTLAADPGSDRVALGVLTDNQDAWLCVWDGTGWELPETGTTSMTGTTYPGVAVAFEGLSGDGIATYGEGSQVRYRTWASGTGWSGELPVANLGETPNSMILDGAPGTDQIMLSVQDGSSGLNCVRWDGSSWGAPEEIEVNTGEIENQPFVFLWDVTGTGTDLAIGMGVNNGSPAEGDTVVYTLSLGNNGPEDATGVEVADLLPSGLTYVSDQPSQGTYAAGSGVWYVGDLTSGSNATLGINASVDAGTDGQTIVNTATVAALDQDDPNPANNAVSVNISVKETRFRVATGHYNGDGGLSQSISDVGFSPDLVIVKGNTSKPTVARSSTMPGGFSKELGTNHALLPDLITSLDANGFTVGPSDHVNGLATDYYWVAFQAAEDEMAVGSYVGNGGDDRSIEAPGFQPGYVIVIGEDSEHAMQRFAAQDFDKSKEFGNSGEKSDRIQAFEALGFQVGKHNTVNEQDRTFHFVAWKAVPGHAVDSTYVGDGVSGREVTGLGFEPQYVIVASKESEDAVHRFGEMSGDNTFIFDNDIAFAEGIQSFLADGFRVGSHKRVNENSKTIFCMAFRDNSPPELAPVGPKSVDEGVNLNFTVSASDPDGTTPSLTAENVPANATFVDNADGTGTFDFNPDYTQAGLYSVRFIASDGALADSIMVGITVNNTNRPPELGAIGPKTVDEGANLNFTVSASDPDGTTPSLSAEDVPANAAFLDNGDGTGTFDFDPDYTQAGVYNVRFIASDGAMADSELVAVTVNNTNRPPELAAIGPKSVDEGANLNFTVSASDPDGTTPALSAEDVPANATFLDNGDGTGTFDFDPDYSQAGIYNVRFIASDGALADSELVQITVTESNRPPELASIGPKSVDEGQNLNFTVSASDPDGTTPSLTAEDVPSNAAFLDNGDGTGTFDFDPDFGQSGIYNVRFIASDGALADSELVQITVTESNRPPDLAAIGPKSVDEGANLNFTVSASDPDGTTPSFSAEDVPSNATFLDNGDGTGTFDFDPDYTQAGVYNVRFIASDGAMADSELVAVTVNNTNRPPDLAAIGPKSVDEGATLNFTVSASDPDGTTPSLSAEDVPSNAAFLDNGDGTGTFDFDPDYTQAGVYNVRFIASDGAMADSELVAVTVNNANRPPELAAIGPKSVDEGANLNFTVSASDPDGTTPSLTAEDVPANAAFLDNGDGTGTFDFDPDYTQAGVYNVRFIASDGAMADSELVDVTVMASPLAYVVIQPDSAVVSADSILQFAAAGYDAGDEPEDPGSITWALIDPLGSIDSTGLFEPTTAGITRVTGTSSLGPVDTTAYLEVIPGSLAALVITPDRATISADSTVQFMVAGYDSDGNEVGSLGSITWQVLGDIGAIDATGLFTARRAGTGFVKSSSDLGVWAKTDTITVVPGDIFFINTTPSSQIVIEDSSFQFNTYAFDADTNLVADVTTDAAWTTTDPSGSVTADGLYTAGSDPSPPTYYVKAALHVPLGSLHTLTDSTAITVISSGSLDHVRVEYRDGTEFEDTTLSADNDTTVVFCRGYDSGNTLIGDLAATWTVVGDESVGSVDTGPDVLTRLRLGRAGSVRVAATYAAGLSDTTGVITCVAGTAADLVIFPDTATAAAGETIQFTVQAFDADMNPSGPVPIGGWDVLGGIGDISGTGLFTATTAGTGFITCWGAGLQDTTGTINVVPGMLSGLEVLPDSAETGLGGTLTFTAIGSDAYGNETQTGDLMWDVIGDVGGIDAYGVFTALAVGSGRISATSDIGGVTDTNSVVIVNPSNLNLLVIDPDTASVRISGQVKFSAYGYDDSFDPVEVGPLTWEVLGGIGAIDEGGWFTATTRGTGRVAATGFNGTSDTTDMIVVEVPTIDEIPIGHRYAHAEEENIPILAFRISNAFDGRETLEGIVVRDASIGAGSPQEVASNFDTLTLYMDADESLSLSLSDIPLSHAPLTTDTVALSFPPVTIGPGAERTFFVSAGISRFPCDGDFLDLYLLPADDIVIAGGTLVVGADTINSLGYVIIDGLVAAQLDLVPTGISAITPQDGVCHVLTVDIPRNGYNADILEILSVFNAGSADTADIDSLLFYRDGGDGVWTGPGDEIDLGSLHFTGGQWEISGLSEALTEQVTRFYIGALVSPQAANGRTVALGVPLHGLEMASENDGPIDAAVIPIESISVSTPEVVSVSLVALEPGEVIPGQSTGPVLGIEFSNGYDVPVVLDTLRVESGLVDPGGAAQDELDGQVEGVELWLNLDGDFRNRGPADSLVAAAILADGAVSFSTPGLALPPGGGTVGLFIECNLSLTKSKNGNFVAFTLPVPDNIRFETGVSMSGDFPLTTGDHFVINAFPAAAATVFAIPGTTLFGKQTDKLFLDFLLPRNGYADDELTRLRIVNTGTTADRGALGAVRLWADAGEEGFSGDDIMLGEFDHRGGGLWEIDGLGVPVSEGGRRFLVTADVAAYGFEGGTAGFEVPVKGADYASGMDGPDDRSIGNPDAHFLFPTNRITVIPIPKEYATVAPGESRAQVLTFALYNGYPEQTHVLRELRLANSTRSKSSAEFADFELGQVSLYYDRNTSRALDDDSLMAAGYFDSGTLNLSGLDLALAAESLAYFFVTANLPVDVIDSDTLAVTVEEPSDFSFMETVNINGDFPVSRGEALEIDGSVRIQYDLLGVESHTLAPGDKSVPVLALRPAVNGDIPDTLDSLTVTNLGDADATDVSRLSLYLDMDDDRRAEPGDVFLGQATHMDGNWRFADLDIDIDSESKTLLVVADISEEAASNRTVRAAIPVDGCRYASSNDGPRDEPVVSGQTLAISSSVLKVTYDNLSPSYSVGQGISLKVRVTNLLSVPVSGVSCDISPAGGQDLIDAAGAFIGPSDLGPDQTVEFHTNYTAAGEGEVFWRIQAFAVDPEESSGVIFTESVVIQSAPTGVSVEMVSSIPTSVTRGQTRVFPLSIRYRHSEGSPLAASVRLDSVRVYVEDESGIPQPADGVFSRLVLATGYTNLAIVDAPPNQSSVTFRFAEPALLAPGLEQVLSLRVDIDSSATAQSFALVLDSDADLRFFDCNTAAEVPIDPTVTFPLRTAACRISNPSQSLAVSYLPSLGETVNRGQQSVDVIRLILRHPGEAGESQVQFTGLSFRFVDAERAEIVPSDVFESIRLVRQQTVVGELSSAEIAPHSLTAMLTAPPVVSPGETDTVKVEVSIRPDATEPSFGMEIQDSTCFVLRDLSSGALVRAVSDDEAPVIGGVFPMWSGSATLRMPAEDPEVCPESRLPASLIAGSDGIDLMELAVSHTGGEDQSAILLEKVRAAVTDSLSVPLDPRMLFDRVGVRIEGGPADYQEFITVESGNTVFEVGDAGLVVEPGARAHLILVADVEAETPFDHFMLRLYPENGVVAADNTDRQRVLALHADPACPAGLPFATGVARVYLPAGSPVVKRHGMETRIAYPGQIGLEFFEGEISYKSTGPRADLILGAIEGQVLSRTGGGLVACPAGEVFAVVRLLIDDITVAVDSVLAGNAVSLVVESEYLISRGDVKTVTLACDLRPDARRGNYLVSFGDSTFMSLLDHDLETEVRPILSGADYPLLTADISITAGSLSGSFVNWPNPFNPDEESTRLGFVLPEEARVDIEVFSITGELVRTIASGASRPAGSNQGDTWDGRNDPGQVVLPGTYFCRIKVEYQAGGSEEATRRVAVIR